MQGDLHGRCCYSLVKIATSIYLHAAMAVSEYSHVEKLTNALPRWHVFWSTELLKESDKVVLQMPISAMQISLLLSTFERTVPFKGTRFLFRLVVLTVCCPS
jgi:hypothetical protein